MLNSSIVQYLKFAQFDWNYPRTVRTILRYDQSFAQANPRIAWIRALSITYISLGPKKKPTFSIIILKCLSYSDSNGGYVLYPKMVTLRHSDGATHRRLLHTFILPKMVSISVTMHDG